MSYLTDLKDRAVAYVKDLYAREPARVNAAAVAAVIAVAAASGVALDNASVAGVVAVVLSVLLGGEVTRSKVEPTDPEV